MSYITRTMACQAINKMQSFHSDIVNLYHRHDMDLLDNLGRRNIVMSQAQEEFFSQVLSETFKDVIADGKTGQPDILIGSLNKELECKLTSRHKGGAISFQTDYTTLAQKGELDYLYVIADHAFEKFAVLHFTGLTTNDFRPLSNGARGKVAMKKYEGMKKCNVLLGNAININERHVKKLSLKLLSATTQAQRDKINKKIEYWKTSSSRYSFELEDTSIPSKMEQLSLFEDNAQVTKEVSPVAP